MYASATQLLERYSADEIAQRADPSIPRIVYGELLTLAAAGGDLSSYTPEEQAAVGAALTNVERALQDAEDTINGYIGGRYQLPLAQVPGVLRLHTCQIARFVLYEDDAPKHIANLYESSLKFLGYVCDGSVQLGLTAFGSSAAPAAGAAMVSTETVFGRERGKGFI